MNADTLKEVMAKASGWSSFSYVETKVEKSEDGSPKTEIRYEMNLLPKKSKCEWVESFGRGLVNLIVKLAPYLTMAGIVYMLVEFFSKA